MIPSLINAVIAVLVYVLLTSWQKKLNVIDYIKDHKAVLGITTGILFVVAMFGTAALMLAIVTFLIPYLVAYSVPSIIAKVVDIWAVVMEWVTRTFGK